MLSLETTRIGEGGPEISKTALAYAASIGVADDVVLLENDGSLRAIFESHFSDESLTVTARRRDWVAGLRFHSLRPWLSGKARSSYLLHKLKRFLDSENPTLHQRAGQIADLFARGAWWNGYNDEAAALWHRGAAFMTGLGTTAAFVERGIRKTVMGSLTEQGIFFDSDIAAKLPAELNMGDSWPYFTYHSSTQRFLDGNTMGIYAYETPFAFRPVVLRFFPKTRTIHSPDLQTHYCVEPEKIKRAVSEELAQLDAWAEAGIPTASIFAQSDNWYARERIFGPKKPHLRVGTFHGLSQSAVDEAHATWSRIPSSLVKGGFMSQEQAQLFAEDNTAYNLVNGTWTALRPACSIDNIRRLA